jgi:ADP-ribose pyrophosphatase
MSATDTSKIPPHAKLVFKGKIYETYQWDQELYNGKTTVFEMLKRNPTVNIIPVTESKEIIYAYQEQPGKEPMIGFPAGRVEHHEEPERAARRELREETGYGCQELVLWDLHQPSSKIEWLIYTYIAKGCKKVTEQELDGGEKISLRFATFDTINDIILHPQFREDEIALKMLKLQKDPTQWADFKKQLLGDPL